MNCQVILAQPKVHTSKSIIGTIGKEIQLKQVVSPIKMLCKLMRLELFSNTNSSVPVKWQFLFFKATHNFPANYVHQFCSSQSPLVSRAFLLGLLCENAVNQTPTGGKHGSSNKNWT